MQLWKHNVEIDILNIGKIFNLFIKYKNFESEDNATTHNATIVKKLKDCETFLSMISSGLK